MPLPAGEKLGVYEILAPLGAGGMGEVYRARDTRLERDAAIKVLLLAVANDPERMARFDREAKILAAMNHPNIAVIYGLIESEGQRALAMELVQGETLEDRIKRGALPLDELLPIARQIAEALEAAHERGIVHRDLKPANVMITPAGVVKVLDFGLAAMTQPGPSAPGGQTNSPTLTMGMTQAGVIMGTAAYMAPEQASGMAVDKRADIWSFGVVLYEMLSGQRLFAGDTVAHTLADVLRAPVEFDKVTAPAPIKSLLRRCLDRRVSTRLRDIGEARILLDSALDSPITDSQVNAPQPAHPPARRHNAWLPWCVAAFVLLALMPVNILHFRESPPPEQVLRYTLAPPDNGSIHSFAVSPDGRFVAIAAEIHGKRQLWLRPLGALEAQPMPTTDDARYPFWSPDGRYIGFFAQGKLRKIEASGGPSQPICDSGEGRGGSWNSADVIVFSDSGSATNTIRRVSAAGGVPSDVTTTKTRYLFPDFLPDGRHFLYSTTGISADKNGIYLATLDGKENRRILADPSRAEFVRSTPQSHTGHILFLRENTLMAQPFDAERLQTTGDVIPVVEHVAAANQNSYAPVTGSENGVVLYWTGGTGGGAGSTHLEWYNRAGMLLESVETPGTLPAISPDEKTIAFARQGSGPNSGLNRDIWTRDLVRGTDRRFTSDPSQNLFPAWSPKGDRIAFASDRGGAGSLYQKATNSSGPDELLLTAPNREIVDQWSRDGRFLVYSEMDPKTDRGDIWVLPMEENSGHKPTVFLHTEFSELHGQLSPDSHWMAYTSDISGQREVYLRAFPAGDTEERISVAGGDQPRWRGDGKELFYIAADKKLMAVPIKLTAGSKPRIELGKATPLFDSRMGFIAPDYFTYDVTADGKRFLLATSGVIPDASSAAVPPLTVMVNWNASLKN